MRRGPLGRGGSGYGSRWRAAASTRVRRSASSPSSSLRRGRCVSFLADILAHKRRELALARERTAAEPLAKRPRRRRSRAAGARSRAGAAARHRRDQATLAEQGEIRPDLDASACAKEPMPPGRRGGALRADGCTLFWRQPPAAGADCAAVTLPLLRKFHPRHVSGGRGARARGRPADRRGAHAARARAREHPGAGLDVLVGFMTSAARHGARGGPI